MGGDIGIEPFESEGANESNSFTKNKWKMKKENILRKIFEFVFEWIWF